MIHDIAEKDAKNKRVMSDHDGKLSKKDFERLADFIDRDDLYECQDIITLEKNENFSEAEVVVLFKNEFFVKCKKKQESTFHNETLGMDADFKFEWDSAVSLIREDVSSISVLRPPLCNCESCTAKREKGERPEQAKYYILEIATPAKDYSIRIPKEDREGAFALQDYLRQWRFQEGEFAKRSKRKTNKRGKK